MTHKKYNNSNHLFCNFLFINNLNNKIKEINFPCIFKFTRKIKLPLNIKIFNSGLGENYFVKHKIKLPSQLKEMSLFFSNFVICSDPINNKKIILDKGITKNISLTIIYERYEEKEIYQQKYENNLTLFEKITPFIEKQKLYKKYNSNIVLHKKQFYL